MKQLNGVHAQGRVAAALLEICRRVLFRSAAGASAGFQLRAKFVVGMDYGMNAEQVLALQPKVSAAFASYAPGLHWFTEP